MSTAWDPPFCANDLEEVECPKCGTGPVCVREQDYYRDGDETEAYCGFCHAMLFVTARVTIEFDDPELADSGAEDAADSPHCAAAAGSGEAPPASPAPEGEPR